jgi:hypothetical protein
LHLDGDYKGKTQEKKADIRERSRGTMLAFGKRNVSRDFPYDAQEAIRLLRID